MLALETVLCVRCTLGVPDYDQVHDVIRDSSLGSGASGTRRRLKVYSYRIDEVISIENPATIPNFFLCRYPADIITAYESSPPP